MQRIILQGTHLEVSKIGFGTASLHHSFSSSGRRSILKTAFDGGVTHFDTARLYGNGIAEKELGCFFEEVGRKHLTVSTKVGFNINSRQKMFPMSHIVGKKIINKVLQKPKEPLSDFTPVGCEKSFSESLRCLKTEWVDILFVHEPVLANFEELENLIPWLRLQKSLGKAKYIGLAGERLDRVQIEAFFPNVVDIFQTSSMADNPTHHLPIQPQIHYGCFANLSVTQRIMAMEEIVTEKESRMVLYSSRQPARIRSFCAKFSSP